MLSSVLSGFFLSLGILCQASNTKTTKPVGSSTIHAIVAGYDVDLPISSQTWRTKYIPRSLTKPLFGPDQPSVLVLIVTETSTIKSANAPGLVLTVIETSTGVSTNVPGFVLTVTETNTCASTNSPYRVLTVTETDTNAITSASTSTPSPCLVLTVTETGTSASTSTTASYLVIDVTRTGTSSSLNESPTAFVSTSTVVVNVVEVYGPTSTAIFYAPTSTMTLT